MSQYLILLLALVQIAAFGQAPKGTIKGKTSCNGIPLSYTSVGVAGTSFGTTSNSEGLYEIQNVPSGSYTLIFSNIGYQPEEVSVSLSPGGHLAGQYQPQRECHQVK
jgi:iron complex outermembrane receptor protein